MDINQLTSQLQSLIALYSELLLCIIAAGLLGWWVGLMMQRSRHDKKTAESIEHWEDRYSALDQAARADSEALEEQLQSLAKELKSLQTTNRTLTDTIKKNDSNIQQSRAEAIELNRQHTETHERLQRIIQQKDQEIAELGNRLHLAANTHRSSEPVYSSRQSHTPRNLHLPDVTEGDLNNADTIAITPNRLLTETFDATVQMNVPSTTRTADNPTPGLSESAFDLSFDDTADLSEGEQEESTVAMDEEALALARQSYKRKRNE